MIGWSFLSCLLYHNLVLFGFDPLPLTCVVSLFSFVLFFDENEFDFMIVIMFRTRSCYGCRFCHPKQPTNWCAFLAGQVIRFGSYISIYIPSPVLENCTENLSCQLAYVQMNLMKVISAVTDIAGLSLMTVSICVECFILHLSWFPVLKEYAKCDRFVWICDGKSVFILLWLC